jgi:hypothetical protein
VLGHRWFRLSLNFRGFNSAAQVTPPRRFRLANSLQDRVKSAVASN